MSILDAVRSGKVSTRFGLASGQVTRDGFRIDTPLGTADNRDTPIHDFMRNMDESEGFMRPTQFQMRFNLDEGLFDKSRLARGDVNGGVFQSSNPLGTLFSSLQDFTSDLGDRLSEKLNYGATSPSKYEAININCHRATIPSETFAMASDQKLAGRNRRYPVSRAYSGEITVSFYVSRDGFERTLFDEWQNLIIPHRRHVVQFPQNYTQNLELIVFRNDSASNLKFPIGRDESEAFKVHFEKAYPVAIREIELDYSSTNQVSQMDVTFYFERSIEDRQQNREDEHNNSTNSLFPFFE